MNGGREAPLSVAEAAARIGAAVTPITDRERVGLLDALGRILGENVVSPVDVPPHDNAAMDGFAFRGGADAGRRLRLVGTSLAGRPFDGRVEADACVRIMTGAVMPDACDTVVPLEEAECAGNEVVVGSRMPVGHNRRLAGEDLRRGAIAIPFGHRVSPSELGLFASMGVSSAVVVRRPRVAVFSTGDELVDVDAPSARGAVRDSNRYTLIGMLERLGALPIDLGIVADAPGALAAALARAVGDSVRADAIVTSGGVSAGDADHTRAVMQSSGTVAFWKLAIKPGRPMAFGRVGDGPRAPLLFGLPGNPVAVMVVFHALVRDALLAMMGARPRPRVAITARCDVPLSKKPGRTEYVRGIAVRADDGWHVRTTGAQGSGILRSMSDANCLIVLDERRGDVATGETVEAWPFDGLV